MASTTRVKLNSEELKDYLRHMITNNIVIQERGITPISTNIEGEAGIGKTSTIVQLAKELDMNFIRLNLAEIEELGDLVGFPLRQFEMCKEGKMVAQTIQVPETRMVPVKVKQTITENRQVQKQVMGGDGKLMMRTVTVPVSVEVEVEEMQEQTIMVDRNIQANDGACIWVDEHAVNEYAKQNFSFTGKKRMSYCPPEWITGLDNRPGILCLDDYTRADQRFIQACMTLIETQTYMSWELPKGWTIILTTNPDDGEYLVTPMDDAQKTRFVTVDLKFDVNCWAKWAEQAGIDGRCVNFLLLHPELVQGTCNARSIVTFFNAIYSIEDFSSQLPLIQMIGEGSVGPEFSYMFTTFINNKLDKLVTPKDILLHDNESYIIGELRNCIGRGGDYRADIASVLTTRLINFTINYSNTNSITQKVIDRLIKLSTDEETLTDDLKYVLIKKVLNGNKTKFNKLMTNGDVMRIAMK
jgi:hypothetical protein